MTITIRPIITIEECQYFQELERRVWSSEEIDIMPIHVLVTVAKNGGIALGAFTADGPPELGGMVGTTLGWHGLGVDKTTGHAQIKLCSHMAGVQALKQLGFETLPLADSLLITGQGCLT